MQKIRFWIETSASGLYGTPARSTNGKIQNAVIEIASTTTSYPGAGSNT